MNGSSSGSSGVGFIGLLQILFIALKLTGLIAWPWVWVLVPLWTCLLISALVVGLVLLVAVPFGKRGD